MVEKQKQRKRTCRSGTTLVEAAIVFPLILLLTLGVIEYGWLFLKAQEITNATRHGARIAVRPDATPADVLAAIDSLMVAAGLDDTGYQVELTPLDISALVPGDTLNVRISVPCENVALINAPALLPTPTHIRASISMAKEGP